MNPWERTQELIGNEALEKLKNAKKRDLLKLFGAEEDMCLK